MSVHYGGGPFKGFKVELPSLTDAELVASQEYVLRRFREELPVIDVEQFNMDKKMTEDNYITITKAEFTELKKDSEFLKILRAQGLVIWSGYDKAYDSYMEHSENV